MQENALTLRENDYFSLFVDNFCSWLLRLRFMSVKIYGLISIEIGI